MMKFITYFVLLFLVCPTLILLSYLFYSNDFTFLLNTTFQRYIFNTIILATSVGIITSVLGTISAALIAFFDFPGKRLFQLLLFLPLAFPSYITAFTYGYIFEFAGPIQTFLRVHCNINYFPNIKSLPGAIFVMSFSFYPYVYMLVRANFISLGYMINTARIMGKSTNEILYKIILPISRPAIVSSAALIIMEVVADFATSQFLAVDTFTTGIYRTWFLLNDYPSAARLTSIIMIFIFCILHIEQSFRKNKIYSGFVHANRTTHVWKITNFYSKIATYSLCIFLPSIGFFIPLIPLIYWAIESQNFFEIQTLTFLNNSLLIAGSASIIIVILSIIFSYSVRKKTIFTGTIKILNMGYAMPSSVIAIGIVIFLAALSKYINMITVNYFNIELNCMLIGTIFALLYAYTVRFVSVSIGTMESGFSKIPREIDWISYTLGYGDFKTCVSIHMPILSKTIITAFLLVFIDIIKELSATLIIRPFNFETISTRTYDLIMDERYKEAASPALIIMMIGIISILLMRKIMDFSKNNTKHFMS